MTSRATVRRRLGSAVAVLLVLPVLAACGGGGGGGGGDQVGGSSSSASASDGGDASGPGWTVLHYSLGDNNLEPFEVTDLNEIGAVGSTDDLHVRELMDRSADYGDDPALDQGSWVGGRVLDIGPATAQGGTAELADDLGDVDSADPATLASFIADGITAHPAGHYALIISDHGGQWLGIGPDEGSGGDTLDLPELSDAISSGLAEAGVDKLDLLGFDACLMAGFEVAGTFASVADRLVASQELEPGHGWNYAALQTLADDPMATADDFGEAILAGYDAQAQDEGDQDSITLSLIDLTKIGAVEDAVASFGSALTDHADTVGPAVGKAEADVLAFAKSPDPSQDRYLLDLGQLAVSIGTDSPDLADPATGLASAVGDAVVDQVDGASTAGATGLSIYFPPVSDVADGAYADVPSATSWVDFLTSYYTAGEAIPTAETARFTEPGDQAQAELGDDGVYVSGDYSAQGADNLTDATIGYALVEDDGSLTYLGEEPAEIGADGSPTAQGFYDLTALTISDGEDTVYGYTSLDYVDGSDAYTVDVPMAYYAADDVNGETYQDALLEITIDASTSDVLDETYYALDEASGGYGELSADPDGIVVPEVLKIRRDGTEVWTASSDTGLYADLENLQYAFEPLDSGTQLQMDLTVYDYGDNTSTVSALVEVP